MQIDRIFFPTFTLGFGKRISIWTIGCPRRCKCCSNPELWESDPTRDIEEAQLVAKMAPYLKEADGVTITGGDPFFQLDSLYRLLINLRYVFDGEILVFTGYTMAQIMELGEKATAILSNIDILIDGPYIDELNDNRGMRGSSNQNIIVLNDRYADRYNNENCERKSQLVQCNGKLVSIGIPIKS